VYYHPKNHIHNFKLRKLLTKFVKNKVPIATITEKNV
jgi:hypothetical protein